MGSKNINEIHVGNSIVSIETLPEYDHPVVIKKPAPSYPSHRILLDLRREYEMTRTLDGVKGIRKAYKQTSINNQPVLILEYIEGEILRDRIRAKSLSLNEKLEIAVDLAQILKEVHQENVIHMDLNSHNILIAHDHLQVRLIDLGSATRIDRGGHHKIQPDHVVGNLSCVSPEQTGRLNRAVDERSDLYSLGVVLYELIAGQLPFDSKDPIELVHQHIARAPVSPSKVSSGIPDVLSAIILKLLSKDAEDRYQSAAGVQADLEKCLQRLKPDNTIADFPLGEADYAGRLIFSQKLYGREGERKELEKAYESACQDTSSIVFVGGYSGIGKTALVEEIQRPVSEKNGYFIEGKFDQMATTPYAGITQALTQFVSQILTLTETKLATWRSQILGAVGPNGRVLTDVVPSFEQVIGPQPVMQDLSGQEAQNRFNYVFQRFFRAIARSEHPICFFLDDLQWVDPGSLGLLKALFTSPDLVHLLVIGAYRDNEVDEDHPLMTLIADMEKAGVNLKRITLQKLEEADVEALISDALRLDPGEVRELSRLVYAQTDGNPFFTRQVLLGMENQSIIALDTATGRWRWDMDALSDQDVIDSVVELLVGKLKELPADTQETLKVAACTGNQFDIATLKVVTAADDDTIIDHVKEAVAAGLIWKRDDRGFFIHDRVQEAAYALVPPEDRDRLHLTIGRLLLKGYRASDVEQDLYQIVDQLNHGLHLVEDEQERMQIAQLNLQAAQAARQASAFHAGLNYAQAGIGFLGRHSWNQDYQLTLALHEKAALLAHAAGDIQAMEQHIELVLQFGHNPLDLARVQKLHIEFLLSSKRFDEAIDFGLEALSILGQEFPPNPDMALATAKLSELLDRLEREPPDYFSMPLLRDQDPELLAITEIMFPVANAAFAFRPALAPLIYMRSLELSLERQVLSEDTPAMIAVAGLYANALLGMIDLAYAFGETAVKLASREDYHSSLFKALHVHALYNYFWYNPLRETLDLFNRALQSARDFGNNEFVSYATFGWSKHSFYASIELAQVEERSLRLRTFLDSIKYLTQSRYVNIFMTAAKVLRGSSSARSTSWRGTPFDDDRDLTDLHRVEDHLGLLYAYCAKAWVATLFGDHDGVEEFSDLSNSFLAAAPSGLEKAILTFICGLRRARELRGNPEMQETKQDIEEYLGSLERFTDLAPMNFAHKLSLVQAEVHRARGEVLQAMQAYEQASQGALENGYLSEAGLAYALAAEFFQDSGLHQAALHNAKQAVQAWRSWGAAALVESLGRRLPDLLGPSDLSWQSTSDAGNLHTTISSIQLDMESVIGASQMLSAETDLEQLLTKMITLVMANSGADKVVLLVRQENEWFVQAQGDNSGKKYDILLNQPVDLADRETDFIPEPIFNYCQRSKETLVVGNATLDQRFGQDRTIQKHRVLSLACIPVMSQGKLKAMLYLENCQMADVFTLERQQVIKVLATQFGISMENAMLYDRLDIKKRELEVSEMRFRSLVENAEEAIVVAQDNLVKYANNKIEELTGYSAAEIAKMEFEKLVHPDDLHTVLSEYQARLSGDQPANKYSIRIISKQGQTKHVYINSARIDWDDRPATLALITDITQLKEVESDLRISKERYELAVTGSDAGIWDYSISTGEIYYSDRFKELMGYEPHEMNDHTPEQSWNRLHPDFREIAPLKLNQHLEKQTPYYHIEYLVQTKSGEYRWFQARGKAVWDENGNPIRIAGSFVDIHDRKNSENEIRQAYDEIKSLKDQLQAESEYLRQEIKLEHNFKNIIGQSEALKYVLHRVEQVAPVESPVLIMGETGTGKELVARALHELSPHGKRALVKVNCAALPRELIESELFGREKGAYTGAMTAQVGRFELASGSTLFLDEIGELPLELQAKLLRVLGSGEFEKLGSSRTLYSDARIIAATNRDLEEEVRKGRFREDLWYRLKVFPITVPPLRQRPEDIPLLVTSFVDQLARKMGKRVTKVPARTMKMLQSYPWPGNVRELMHAVESALIVAQGDKLNFDLPQVQDTTLSDFKSFKEMERDYILSVLKAKNWKIKGRDSASTILGLPPSTLRHRIKKLGLKKP